MRPGRWLPLTLLLTLVVSAVTTVALAASGVGGRTLGDAIDDAATGKRFSLVDFELQHVLNGSLGEVGAFLAGRRDSGADADRILERYFALGTEITTQTNAGAGDAELAPLRAERRKLENRVERILETRVADVYRAAGFSRSLPLFGSQRILWPPVDAELARPPRVLALSPREEIRLLRTVLLEPGLSLREIERIEAELEADGRYSAIVDTIGGLAAYPAIVRDTRSYVSTVETIAHEWLHHYFYFYPLGRAFFNSTELRSINETVADTIDAEIAARVFAAYPNVGVAPAPRADRSEADALLVQLRRDIDALLTQGRVQEAERLMEDVRLELAREGRRFRRINQAFFAFNGVYATRPAGATNPIGPLVRDLRARSPDLLDFVEAAREVDSLAALQALAP